MAFIPENLSPISTGHRGPLLVGDVICANTATALAICHVINVQTRRGGVDGFVTLNVTAINL